MKKGLVIGYTVIYLICEYIIIQLVSLFMSVASYKDKMAELQSNFSSILIDNAIHPIKHLIEFISTKNPLFIVLSIALILFLIAIIFKQSSNLASSELEYDSKGTHGSARWGTLKEVVQDNNFKTYKKNKFFGEWLKTLDEGENNE